MRGSLYTFETYKRILDLEERRGRLKKDTFSEELKQQSAELKELRKKLKNASKTEKTSLTESLANKKNEYEEKRVEEIREIAEHIQNNDFKIELREVNAKGKLGYTTDNVESLLLSKVLMLELKRSYKYTPANRNNIIEELRALLDNPMPKIVIRADIHAFFESIPQDKLIGKILEDAYLSAFGLKCLKTFLYRFNELSGNLETKVGIPRGLSFSSYLSEIYMASFDRRIRQIEGVYFYKRYVDDIIIIANPSVQDKETYWKRLEQEVDNVELTLSEDNKKRSCQEFPSLQEETVQLNYLGYQFRYRKGILDVLLTEDKYNRLMDCVRLSFEKYKEIGNHTSRRKHPKEKKEDATIQFMHRLNALTANGHLNGRKNYVLVGIYYSNKYLNNLEQLERLDEYLKHCFLDKAMFCPPKTMFNYGQDNDYPKNVAAIKKKAVETCSFVKGFKHRSLYRWNDYTYILKQLGNLYYSQEKDE